MLPSETVVPVVAVAVALVPDDFLEKTEHVGRGKERAGNGDEAEQEPQRARVRVRSIRACVGSIGARVAQTGGKVPGASRRIVAARARVLEAARSQLQEIDRQLLVERHLISRELSSSKSGAGVVISRDQAFSVMLNEEDHLRIQVLRAGFQFKKVWATINALDGCSWLRDSSALLCHFIVAGRGPAPAAPPAA